MNERPPQRHARWLAALVLVFAGIAVAGVANAASRPNILVLMAEDMGPRVGAFGDPVARTPNIDRLASAGVRFPNTFTTAGVCAPSRAAHITAMYQTAIGAQHMRTSSFEEADYRSVPPERVKAYPEWLRRAGYYTFTDGKLDYQFSGVGAGSGPFTIWDREGADPGWEGRAPGQPFFGLVSFNATHESGMFPERVKTAREAGRNPVTLASDVGLPPYYPDVPAIRHDTARHYDNIHAMDAMVGSWLERLERAGLDDDTIVVWTTDHGDGLPRAKRELYDSGTRVPLVVRWPERWRPMGMAPGSVDDRLVSFVDIGPSVLAWARVAIPDYVHGRPLLADPALSRRYVFGAKDRIDAFEFAERAVRDGRYRYLLNLRSGQPGARPIAYRERLATMGVLWAAFDAGVMSDQQAFWFEPRPREEFYDLAVDPHEVNNLAADPGYAEPMARLREALVEWRSTHDPWANVPEIEMARRFWPGGEAPSTPAPKISWASGMAVVDMPGGVEGASIGYRVDGGRWRLYRAPISLKAGERLEARAVRYGWAASPVIAVVAAPGR